MKPRKNFRNAVESNEPDQLPSGIAILPVDHCGSRVLNTPRKFVDQINDWTRIGNFLQKNNFGTDKT